MIAPIAVGKKHKNKRRTLTRQVQRLEEEIRARAEGRSAEDGGPNEGTKPLKWRWMDIEMDKDRDGASTAGASANAGEGATDAMAISPANANANADATGTGKKCRNCEKDECDGACWGFFGLGRLQAQAQAGQAEGAKKRRSRPNRGQRAGKQARRDTQVEEEGALRSAPHMHRVEASGVRRTPAAVRVLEVVCKGRWCGRSLLEVCSDEFAGYGNREEWRARLDAGLVAVNGQARGADDARPLANGETLRHTVHWHEPPVVVPAQIGIQRVEIPADGKAKSEAAAETKGAIESEAGAEAEVGGAGGSAALGRMEVWAVDKPATVPSHACGSFLANSLVTLVEAQEGLPPRSLVACHRLDRLTSGLIVLAPAGPPAAWVRNRIEAAGACRKTYVAKVRGKFPASSVEAFDRWGMPESTVKSTGEKVGGMWWRLNDGLATMRWTPGTSAWVQSKPSGNAAVGGWGGGSEGGGGGGWGDSTTNGVAATDAATANDVGATRRDCDVYGDGVTDVNRGGYMTVECLIGMVDMDQKKRGAVRPPGTDATAAGGAGTGASTGAGTGAVAGGGVGVSAGADPHTGGPGGEEKGKAATSLLALVAYDAASDTSVVRCRPITGRTHQLRVSTTIGLSTTITPLATVGTCASYPP